MVDSCCYQQQVYSRLRSKTSSRASEARPGIHVSSLLPLPHLGRGQASRGWRGRDVL